MCECNPGFAGNGFVCGEDEVFHFNKWICKLTLCIYLYRIRMVTQTKTFFVQMIGVKRITVPRSLIQVFIAKINFLIYSAFLGQGDIDEDGLGDECDDDKDNDGIKLLEKKPECSSKKANKVRNMYIKSDCIQEKTGQKCNQVGVYCPQLLNIYIGCWIQELLLEFYKCWSSDNCVNVYNPDQSDEYLAP